jgi:glycosyltransferase involved in cell wall biosynthesis
VQDAAALVMKVVHLVIGGEIAGGQLVARRLAIAAREAGHDVAFVSPSAGPFLDRVAAEGFGTHVVPVGGALDARAVARLRRVLREERADILHTHTHFSLNVVGRLAARTAGIAVIAHMHIENVFRDGSLARRAQVALDNRTARLCRWIVAVSEATRSALLAQGYPPDRTVTVHNGVEAASDVRAAILEPRPPGPVLLEVGRLCNVKGQRELIAALPRLARDDVTLVLAGEDVEEGGAFRDELEREARDLGVSGRVRFLGRRDDVPALIAAVDVLVLPSWIEGLPLVVLEAMAAGVPVVATAVGGTAEALVDGETGLLVPPRDVDALGRALDELLADPERARRLGEAGRRRVREQFDAESTARRVLSLYAPDGHARHADAT